jgi:hypothetical protein
MMMSFRRLGNVIEMRTKNSDHSKSRRHSCENNVKGKMDNGGRFLMAGKSLSPEYLPY